MSQSDYQFLADTISDLEKIITQRGIIIERLENRIDQLWQEIQILSRQLDEERKGKY